MDSFKAVQLFYNFLIELEKIVTLQIPLLHKKRKRRLTSQRRLVRMGEAQTFWWYYASVALGKNLILKTKHSFHLCDPSPWPLLSSFSIFGLVVGATFYLHFVSGGFFLFTFSLIILGLCLFAWWRDVVREGLFEGNHTFAVKEGMKFGMKLFIASEVMFFFAFFWGYGHSALNPAYEIGGVWPPPGITPIPWWKAPLVNTGILLNSGVAVTWAHHALKGHLRHETTKGITMTLAHAFFFTLIQYREYLKAPFTISDSVYGSLFFMMTGFHGIHVIIGTVYLLICFIRHLNYHFSYRDHIGFELAIWYWHFVDVVWVLLMGVVYMWGS